MNGDGVTAPDPLDGAFSAQWLTGESFPALQYVVPGLVPEGLSLLSAAPKLASAAADNVPRKAMKPPSSNAPGTRFCRDCGNRPRIAGCISM